MTAADPEPRIHPLAESGLLVELGDAIDPALVARVAALAATLDAAALPGVLDVVPSYTTILVAFDPIRIDPDRLAADVRRLAAGTSASAAPSARLVEIPVSYGGDLGPDLTAVAAHAGLAPTAVVDRHAAAEYVVACMGFAPGFGFLVGLPPDLAIPRRANPRTRVPAGSVGIGGAQTGVYPLETPGGWHLIGRTPLRLFDPDRDAPFLLQPGDRVSFRPISVADYRAIAASQDRTGSSAVAR
jgi:KipI family sensor histidine kinase inhibitor